MNESREQLLTSRVIDGDCTDQEWRDFESLADANPAVWRNLAQEQRDHHALSRAVNGAVSVADCVALSPEAAADHGRSYSIVHERLRRAGTWSGWLTAAAVIAVFAVIRFNDSTRPGSNSNSGSNVQAVGLLSDATADQAWNAYLAKGREAGLVVAEVPTKILIESRPAPSGEGVELLYLRQVVERTIVPDLYEFTGKDERGLPAPTKYTPPTGGAL
jgi:hypothetical protein